MSDLTQRLRDLADCDGRAGEPLGKCMREAADRIAALEADLARAEAKLAEAVSTLQRIVSTSQEMSADYICYGGESGHERTARIAHSTLARIKEVKDNG